MMAQSGHVESENYYDRPPASRVSHQHQRCFSYLLSLSSLLLSLFKHGRHRNFILRGRVSGQEKKLCQL